MRVFLLIAIHTFLLILTETCWSADFLFVSLSNNTVARFDVSSGVPAIIEGSRITYASGFDTPYDLAFDRSSNLYVASYGSNSVNRVGPGGGHASQWATGFDGPGGLAIDGLGNIYVSNSASSGTSVSMVPADGSITNHSWATGFGMSLGLTFGSDGNLYIAIPGEVYRVGPNGGVATYWATARDGVTADIAFADNGSLYISDIFWGTVNRAGPAGGVSTQWSAGLDGSTGLVFGSDGKLFVANQGSHTISKVNSDGLVLFSFSTGLDSPRFLAYVPEPSTYIHGLLSALTLVLARRRCRTNFSLCIPRKACFVLD